LIDMSLSDLRGSAGLREMRRLRPDAMIVAINCPADAAQASVALEAGVAAYVLRSSSPETFAAVLALVLNGERFFPAALLLEAIRSATQRSALRSPDEATERAHGGSGLTPRQFSVMRHIAVGRTNKEIARVLSIQEITVKVHLQAIFARINVTNRTQAAMHAERSGWFIGEPVLQDMSAELGNETTH
ncbi:MAG TPA: response regulator transcription factor, partial [Erythrobacter sp.]|nr:response regulator transcription factor [Erythrobacter sp.]